MCTGNTFPHICNIGVKQELQFKSSYTCTYTFMITDHAAIITTD